eukprot:489340_1
MAPSYRNPDWVVPQLFIGSIECIVCLCCLCCSLYIYRIYYPMEKISLPKTLQLLNMFGILSFLCCSIAQCINIYYYNTFYWTFSTVQTLSWYLIWVFWCFSQFISYLLFLNRIESSFQNSIYEITKCIKTYLYMLLILYALLWITAHLIPFLLFVFNDKINRNTMYRIKFYFSIPI